MVEEIEEIENPLIYEVSITCPNKGCGNVVKIDVEWGSSPAMELALCPVTCEKCGVRID